MCKTISLVVEDPVSDAALRRILQTTAPQVHIAATHGLQGNGYIRRKISDFNRSSRGHPFLVLTDLDNGICAPQLVQEWLPVPKEPNLLFRVAVREVETWLMADRKGMAEFLVVPLSHLPEEVESIMMPKEFLMNAAKRSGNRNIREDIPPRSGSTAKTGADYNGTLIRFVTERWNVTHAAKRSPSLQRTVAAIKQLTG